MHTPAAPLLVARVGTATHSRGSKTEAQRAAIGSRRKQLDVRRKTPQAPKRSTHAWTHAERKAEASVWDRLCSAPMRRMLRCTHAVPIRPGALAGSAISL